MATTLTWSEDIRDLIFWGDVYFAANRCRRAEACWQKALRALDGRRGGREHAAALRIKLAGLYQWTGSRLQWKRYLTDALETLAELKGPSSPLVKDLRKYLAGRKPLFKAVIPPELQEVHVLSGIHATPEQVAFVP